MRNPDTYPQISQFFSFYSQLVNFINLASEKRCRCGILPLKRPKDAVFGAGFVGSHSGFEFTQNFTRRAGIGRFFAPHKIAPKLEYQLIKANRLAEMN